MAAGSSWFQSEFYHPSLNSAIFDGPLRIYFSQSHESYALSIYFGFQQKFQDLVESAKKNFQKNGKSFLVILYPNHETFELAFDDCHAPLVETAFKNDRVLGVEGPFDDQKLQHILQRVSDHFRRENGENPTPQIRLLARELIGSSGL